MAWPWNWVRGRLRSFEMAPLDRPYTSFYWSAIVYIALSGTRDVEKYRDLEIWIRGHWRSFKLVPFESLGAVSYSPSIVISGSILHQFRDKARYWSKIVGFFHTPLHSTPPLWWSPSDYCHSVWCGKTTMVGLPNGVKTVTICITV